MRKCFGLFLAFSNLLISNSAWAWYPSYAYGRGYNNGHGGILYTPNIIGVPAISATPVYQADKPVYYNVPAPINAAPLNSVVIKPVNGMSNQAVIVKQHIPVCYDTRRWDSLRGWVITRICN